MQQYFTSQILEINSNITLDKDIVYHLKKVLRKDSSYIFRIVDKNHTVFLAHLTDDDNCIITDRLDENNELDTDITVILSLIKNDKFELTVQKLTELGVKRIVPLSTNRTVIKVKDDKKKIERLTKIAKEASEQSHRNIVPEITESINVKGIVKYKSDLNLLAYEKQDSNDVLKDINNKKSVTIVIGPEGGFDIDEVNQIKEMGFEAITLGKRILRAETAAIYLTSIIIGGLQ